MIDYQAAANELHRNMTEMRDKWTDRGVARRVVDAALADAPTIPYRDLPQEIAAAVYERDGAKAGRYAVVRVGEEQ